MPLEHVSIEMNGACSLETLFEVLLRAASRIDSIEHTTQRIAGVPTGNAIRYHLDIKNHCRIRTTTKNPVVRLLFVALAFILVNLWVYLLWVYVSISRRGSRLVYHELFPLKTMMEFLSQAVEQHFPPKREILLPANS